MTQGDVWQVPVGLGAPPARKFSAGLWIVAALGAWLVLSVALTVVARVLVFEPWYVTAASMEPTVEVGDLAVVDRSAYRRGSPGRGDIVLVPVPNARAEGNVLKRVVAVEGDTIGCCDGSGRVELNGAPLDEPYLAAEQQDPFERVTVREDMVFVMGDNRTRSLDSRGYGPIPIGSVRGRLTGTGPGAWLVPLGLIAGAAAVVVAAVTFPLALRSRRRLAG